MTTLLPGPLASLLLADYGADVIKIEGPTRPDGGRNDSPRTVHGNSYRFGMLNRNKRSFAVDLKNESGRQAFLDLADTADILIEGFRPGVMARLGLDYETLSTRNPGLIYCSMSGYGQTGPYAQDPGHDINYLAVSGITSLLAAPTDNPDQPRRPPWMPIADIGGGTLLALFGILTALTARHTTGHGDHIDASMTDGIFFWQNARLHTYLAQQREPHHAELATTGAAPGYGIYTTGDNKLLALGALEPAFWNNLRTALKLQDTLPQNQPRNNQETTTARHHIATTLKQHDRDTWLHTLRQHDVPASPVLTMSELEHDPHIQARQLLIHHDLGDGVHTHIGFPIKLTHHQPTLRTPAPQLGAHTKQILQQLDYTPQQITNLTNGNVILQSE